MPDKEHPDSELLLSLLDAGDLPEDYKELLLLLIGVSLMNDLWYPREPVPVEEMEKWPGEAEVDLYCEQVPNSPRSEGLQFINMNRAQLFFRWKHPDFEYPDHVKKRIDKKIREEEE